MDNETRDDFAWTLHRYLLDSLASGLYYALCVAAVVALGMALAGVNSGAVTGTAALAGTVVLTATLQRRASRSREYVLANFGNAEVEPATDEQSAED